MSERLSPLVEEHFKYHGRANSPPKSPTANVKKLYMRELSNVIRKWSSKFGVDGMHENSILPVEGVHRCIVVTICRNRQRILTQAWQKWVKSTNVVHDFEADARQILCRKIPEDELRSELEIEVLYRWVLQAKDVDPTGVANTIYLSKKKSAKYAALQQLRLEFYDPGETVLFQGDIPRQEDGHFTVLKGECDVVQFPDESVPLMKLQYLAKKKRWDDAKKLLRAAQLVARIPKYSGFGELSTLTGVKRAASIRAAIKSTQPIEIAVLPKQALMDCLKSRSQDDASTSEAIDFLRQSGLANRISPKDLVQAARSMVRRTLLQGDILYYKGEPSQSMFLVVSGEFLLDLGEFMVEGKPLAFVGNAPEKCYYLSSGSILGDEGVLGATKTFASTAVVVSTAAVVFEAVGFGLSFLAEKLKSLRYCALFYKDKLRWDNPNPLAEQVNPYTYFNSLRRTIAFTSPFRGVMSIAEDEAKHLSKKAVSPRARSRGKKAEEEEQRFVKSRNKHVRHLDSRASFLMQSAGVLLPSLADEIVNNPYADYPRVLTATGLHRAIEINKVVKRSMQNSMKAHAKETILYEQLRKIPDDETNDGDRVEAQRKFRQGLKDYYKREEEIAKKLREEEEARKLLNSRASTAIRFFASTLDDEENEESEQRIQTNKVSFSATEENNAKVNYVTDQDSEVESHDKVAEAYIQPQLHMSSVSFDIYGRDKNTNLPKILQYYDWLDSLNRAHYRALLGQSRQTADLLHYQLNHGGALPTSLESTSNHEHLIEELGEVFRNFGLTPQDLSIPWQFDKQAPSLARGDSMRPFTASSGPSSPPDSAPKRAGQRRGGVVGFAEDGKKLHGTRSSIMMTRNNTDAAEEMVAKARIENQFKSYNPASWREEMIKKKAQELTGQAYRFDRAHVPDNRRVLSVRVHSNYYIEAFHPIDHKAEAKAHGEQMLQATVKLKEGDEQGVEMNFEDLIDSPEYFMQMLGEQPVGSAHRHAPPMNSWRTRYLNQQKESEKKQTTKLGAEMVRTHLKEDLSGYSKESLLAQAQQLREETLSRPLINMFGEKDPSPSPPPATLSLSRKVSTVSAHTLFSSVSDYLSPYVLGGELEGELSKGGTVIPRKDNDSEVGYVQEINRSLPPLKEEGMSAIRPSLLSIEGEGEPLPLFSVEQEGGLALSLGGSREEVEAGEGGIALSSSEPPFASSSKPSSPVSPTRSRLSVETSVGEAGAEMGTGAGIGATGAEGGAAAGGPGTESGAGVGGQSVGEKGSVRSTRRAAGAMAQVASKRITDTKEPSKALSLFEDYLQLTQVPSQAPLEGRKKANLTSKFRLPTCAPSVPEVALGDIMAMRWKTEWNLFHAMFPQVNEKNKDMFIEAFKKRYPDSSIRADYYLPPQESVTLSYPSAPSMDDLSVGDRSAPSLPSAHAAASSSSHSIANPSRVASSSSLVEEDEELKDWQQFTLQSILRDKEGEKKTLPSLSLPVLHLQGKRYRSTNGPSFIPLVKLASKRDEESIAGPPSYLELYKKGGLQLHMTAKERERTLKELETFKRMKK